MRRGRHLAAIELSEHERERLQEWTRRRKTSQAWSMRARIVLGCAEGASNTEVANDLRATVQTVSKWRRRFVEKRLDGLLDEPRPGKPRTISDARIEKLIATTLNELPAGSTHWSRRQMAAKLKLSPTTIGRVWRAFGLQPHRVETFELSTDPLFVEKVRDIVGLYLDPPLKAMCCVSMRRVRFKHWIVRNRSCRWLLAFPNDARMTICAMAPRPCSPHSTSLPAR